MEQSIFTTLCEVCDALDAYVRDLAPGTVRDHLHGLVGRLDEAIDRTHALEDEKVAWTEEVSDLITLCALLEAGTAEVSMSELHHGLWVLQQVHAPAPSPVTTLDPRRKGR
jgi:hypothetical protein